MKICTKKVLRIAYIMHRGEVSTYGGFPQHVEHSIYGLKQLGHDVDFYFLGNVDKSNDDYVAKKVEKYLQGELYIEGQHIPKLDLGIGTGSYFHVNFGWVHPVTPIKTLQNKIDFKNRLEEYDAVFWHTPFWFKQKSFQKDTDWPMLLDLKNPVNIAFHHDGNIRDNSAWMLHIDKYFDRIITVHPASYNACSIFSAPRCMIFNPQFVDHDKNYSAYGNLLRGGIEFFSLQYWKGSKHVDDLIRAIPHFFNIFGEGVKFVIGGKGLEYAYMNSEEKIKDVYLCNKKNDPDLPDGFEGLPIIEVARQFGLETPLWMNSEQRDEQFRKSLFFVDTAYYTISKELGSHFSRTLIEAMINGVVPIGRNLGLSNNLEGVGEIFKPGENYLMIPYDATPLEFAKKLIEFLCIDEQSYNKIVQNNYELLEHFDILNVCQQYVDVINGNPTGWYNCYEEGGVEIPKKIQEKADKQWFGDGEKRTFNFSK